VRDLARAALLTLNFVLLASPPFLGSDVKAYVLATILVVLVDLALTLGWDWFSSAAVVSPHGASSTRFPARAGSVVLLVAIATTVAALLFAGARTWLRQILVYPNDALRADMLIVVQQGIRRVLQGRNPYTMYQVPWSATLPYGPVLWAPFIVPHLLHADIRFATILGELFVPAACAIAAVGAAVSRRWTSAFAWIVVLAGIAASPDLRGFTSIAHTPVYWPLLGAFAWLVARERWRPAALALGLLIVARTTMISMAPVFAMTVWRRDRPGAVPALAVLAAAVIGPYLPFALWDLAALKYALYGSYETVMKGFVWTSTDWAQNTIGITGLLLRAGWQRAVEPVQIALMLALYAVIWRRLGSPPVQGPARRSPLPWMGAALLAFSMTTLWPVSYIYLDVFLLFTCAALAESTWLRSRPLASAWTASLAVAGLAAALTTRLDVTVNPTIDVGSAVDRPALYSGFSVDEHDGDRTFAWIDGPHAELLVPRRSRTDADVLIVCQPNQPRGAAQEMSVALNGWLLGTVPLHDGWQTVSLPAPARAWQIGVNELTMSFSSAVSPMQNGESQDRRRLSAGLDRVSVQTR
jgi:hypothetical protein